LVTNRKKNRNFLTIIKYPSSVQGRKNDKNIEELKINVCIYLRLKKRVIEVEFVNILFAKN